MSIVINMEYTETQLCELQCEMLNMGMGATKVISGKVITRWSKDAFEVGTHGKGIIVSSEEASEIILTTRQ